MDQKKPFEIKLWMVALFAVGVLCLLFNFDPIGNGLDQVFGKGADKWAINIIIVGLIIYLTFFGKKK